MKIIRKHKIIISLLIILCFIFSVPTTGNINAKAKEPNMIFNYTDSTPHIHTGNPTYGGGCFTIPVYHTHTGTSGSCYAPVYHTHTLACYGTCEGTGGSPNTSTTTITCPRCGHNTLVNYTWYNNCIKCGSTVKSGTYKVCPYPGCNYSSGSAPSGGGTCIKSVLNCSKIPGSTIDSYNLICPKTPGVSIDCYTLSCGYN